MLIALVGAEFEENLSLRTIQAQLLSEGHDVDLVPFNERGEIERVSRRLVEGGADVVGMSLVFTLRAREFADLARQARASGLRAHLTAGGHFAAFHARELLSEVPGFDSVALGEGERIMSDLCRNLGRLDRVRGLVWRRPDGTLQENPRAEKPLDLDELPPPTHKDPFDRFLGLPIANLLGSRGCSHACAFCSIAAWHGLVGGPRLRCRRPESIAREMRDLYGRGVRVFNFHDDNFLMRSRRASLDRVCQLAHALEDEGLGRIAFAIKARPDSVDPEVFTLLKEAGLFRVFLGIEAGTAATLDALGRGQSPADNERALETVNRLDLHACFNLLLFGPDSTLEEIVADVEFLRRHPENPMNFCRTEVYAGTPLAAKLAREGRLIGDFWGYDYRIRDPRAQLLFEVVYPAFRHRNYGLHGLHHRTMAVDYEHQLLAHFWGRDERLRREVKGFVGDVNRNTSEHLLRIAASVGSGEVTDADLSAYLLALTRRIERDNTRLGRRADALMAEIRSRAEGRSSGAPRRWVRKAAAAGLAASLSVATVRESKAAAQARTQMSETIAQPTKEPTQYFEMVAKAARRGDPALVRKTLREKLLPGILSQLEAPSRVLISFSVLETGQVPFCNAKAPEPDTYRLLDCPAKILLFKEPAVLERSFDVEFSQREIAELMRERDLPYRILARIDDACRLQVKFLIGPEGGITAGEERALRDPHQEALPALSNVAQKLRKLLDPIAARLESSCRLELRFRVSPSGRVASCTARNLDSGKPIVCPPTDVVIRGPEAAGRRFRVKFPAREVAIAMNRNDPGKPQGEKTVVSLYAPCRAELELELSTESGGASGSGQWRYGDGRRSRLILTGAVDELRRKLRRIAAPLDEPHRIEVEVRINPKGRVDRCAVHDLEDDKRFECAAANLAMSLPEAAGRLIQVEFPRREVARARSSPPTR